MELIWNKLWPHRLSSGSIRNFQFFEGDVEGTKGATNIATIIASAPAIGVKMKLLRNIQLDVELNQNKLWACGLSKKWQRNNWRAANIIKLGFSENIVDDFEIESRQ